MGFEVMEHWVFWVDLWTAHGPCDGGTATSPTPPAAATPTALSPAPLRDQFPEVGCLAILAADRVQQIVSDLSAETSPNSNAATSISTRYTA